MCRRFIHLVCAVSVLGLFGTVADAQNQIRNWEFDEPFVTGGGGDINTNWWLWESANFTGLSVVQGAALSGENAMHVAIPSGASGSLQVYQSFMKLEQGVTYTISFMARADAPRTITVRLQGRSTNNWTTFWSQSGVQLTTEPQTFTYQYQHTGATVGSTTVFNDGIDWCFDHGGSDVDAYYDHIWLGVGAPAAPGPVVSPYNPAPADGTIYTETWVTLGWSPGDTAVSHDVYFGESFNDVNDGTAGAFRGNLPSAQLFIGLGLPGDPYPAGLVPGTTYYWRVDEVEADAATKHKGPTWSFFIPPRNAYNSNPSDGASFVATDVKLSWAAGLGAKLQTLYFGRSFADVNTGAASANKGPRPSPSYDPGPLAPETTYYWRVDAFDGAVLRTGDVWSFTTTRPGLGTAIAARWDNISGTDLNTLKSDPRYPNNPVVVETVTQFAWNGADTDNYGGRIEAWLYVPATGDYTFWVNTDDQGELWLSTDDDPDNVKLIAMESTYRDLNSWGTGEEQSQPIPLVGGERYYIMALWKEGGGGDHCQVAWQGPSIPGRMVIAGTYLSPYEPLSAYGANPSNGATSVKQAPALKWKPGLQAASHELYFGTDPNAVKNATKTSAEYKGTRTLGAESYSPGTLAWQTTYYWRIDEVNNTNPKSPWVGKVWSFTTADFAVIDDFEQYTDNDAANEAIWQTWIDGFATPTTNGAVVGNNLPPYAERTIIHGGRQSMPLSYDNLTTARNSEAALPLTYPRDWTVEGVTALSLWYYGDPANVSERMYVAVANRTGTPAIVYNDAANPTTMPMWRRWVIPIQDFAGQGINLRDVDRIVIGFGTKGSTAPGGTGRMYIDDIGLYRSASEPEEILLEAEAGTITAPMKTYNHPLASGGKYIGTDDGIGDESTNPPATGVATYNFTAQGGVYKIALRVIITGGSNSFWVRIPGATTYSPGTHTSGWIRFNDISDGAAWHWDEVHSSDHSNQAVSITLPAGQHTLEIARREDGTLLDAVVIMGVQ
jgi:hypothetical protein